MGEYIEDGPEICFHLEEVSLDLPDTDLLEHWLTTMAADYRSEILELTFIFCTDDYLLDINKTHLGHDYYTDIITFPYQQGRTIRSDLFISIDRVADNAQNYGVPAQQELLRVMAHGLLHLIGFGDKTEEEELLMRQYEDKALDLFQTLTTKGTV